MILRMAVLPQRLSRWGLRLCSGHALCFNLCFILLSLFSFWGGKSRLQREKTEKTRSWEAAEGKLPAGSTFSVTSLQLIYTLEGSSAPQSCEIQSTPRRSGSRAQTERGSSKAEIFDNIFYS